MSAPLTLMEIRGRWNDVLDNLEKRDRIAWIAYFDARLADFDGQSLSLDFRDARKFAGGHEYSPTREKLEIALKSSISEVLSIDVTIVEL